MAGGLLDSGIIKSGGANSVGFVNNIGLSLSSGEFKIVPVEGSAFSESNPGYVTCPGATNPEIAVAIAVTGNDHLFIDDAGSSDIIGEEFGVTTGVAWGSSRPFFLYAVNSDDTTSGLEFAISPNPKAVSSPSSSNNIGYHEPPGS